MEAKHVIFVDHVIGHAPI